MTTFSGIFSVLIEIAHLTRTLFTDGMYFMALCARSRTALAAENLFLRKQLAFYQERKVTNHAKVIVACDFLTAVTATFKCLYVFVIIELGTRKLLHIHVTDHPTTSWTQQQLREAISSDQ